MEHAVEKVEGLARKKGLAGGWGRGLCHDPAPPDNPNNNLTPQTCSFYS